MPPQVGFEPSERTDAANVTLGNSGVLSHLVGLGALLLAGMLRSLNAPPTLVTTDSVARPADDDAAILLPLVFRQI